MTDLVLQSNGIAPMSQQSVEKVAALEQVALQQPQTPIDTIHSLHGGVYTRTICIPAGVLLTGAFIKIPTTLIAHGDCFVYVGDKTLRLTGYNIIPASAGRKQAFVAVSDTWLSMIFATAAKTIEQAEREFTDEADMLFSRKFSNTILSEV